MQRKIIHVDMDCFYAAIEMRDNPKLRHKPIAVGGRPESRGVLCTCNYIARQYGVHSAMPTAYALQLCPQLILLPVNMAKYREASVAIREIFFEFTHLVEPLSLDEAYLDVTECNSYHNSATLIAKEIKKRIYKAVALTASAGVAPNKFLAKIASDWQKPDGLFTIHPKNIGNFVRALPVEKLFGVGKVTAKKMHALGLKTCGDLEKIELVKLTEHFGKFGERLYYLSRGIDDRVVTPNRVRKSLSVEHTFSQDIIDLQEMLVVMGDLFVELQRRLKSHQNKIIRNQFVKIKFHDFQLTTVESSISDFDKSSFQLLLKEGYARQKKPVRLLGLGVRFSEQGRWLQQEQLELVGAMLGALFVP